MQILVLFIVGLVVVPILSAHEVRKINKEIKEGNWVIKPIFANRRVLIKPKTFGYLLGIFILFFILLNILNVI